MNANRIVEFEFSNARNMKHPDEMKRLLATQVFTPCGRYGISLPKNYAIKQAQTCITLPVFDFFSRKLIYYRYEANADNQCDFVYCLNSNTLISVTATSRGFDQRVWNLNHQDERVEIETKRTYIHKIDNPLLLAIHERCKRDLRIEHRGKSFNMWISAKPHDMGHHLVFLIPSNPTSPENLKLFYVDLETMPSSRNKVAQHYNLRQTGSVFIAPSVVQGSLRFPARINEKQVFGVWMTLNLEELENMIDSEQVDIGNIREMQKTAYKCRVNKIGVDYEDIEKHYRVVESDYYAGRTHSVFWEKSSTAFNAVMILNSSTGSLQRTCSLLFGWNTLSVLPSGWLVRWSQRQPNLTATGIKMESEGVTTLFKIVQSRLILQNFVDISSIHGIENILFTLTSYKLVTFVMQDSDTGCSIWTVISFADHKLPTGLENQMFKNFSDVEKVFIDYAETKGMSVKNIMKYSDDLFAHLPGQLAIKTMAFDYPERNE